MTDETSAYAQAVQAVVDRVSSWQDGATFETILQELREGAEEADVDIPDEDLRTLAEAIDAEQGSVDAVDVLGL